MAAIFTASSSPNRTSPVIRGKWVLENLPGRRLAEPPADAGLLDDKAGERGRTLREQLAAHRRHESCAGCHDKIDPVGFTLENFDAIGRYRSKEAGRPVDASGTLPGGLQIQGPAQLRLALRQHHVDEFIRNTVRRLSAFALGHALKPQDEGLVRQLLETLEDNDHRADALVEAIVLSEAPPHSGLGASLPNQFFTNDGQRGDGGRLGTQDQRTEGDGLEAPQTRQLLLLFREVTLGTDKHENRQGSAEVHFMKPS